ncbi:hypothetical protein [Enterobacter roggenkampii]|uniref:hypothetical protein n=1 Tax=Enterobacter roggenkampii TaxID=1812935 RepID=UPI002FCE78D7
MISINKQWLQQKIADMEAARDEIPFGLDEDDSNTLAAMKLALASLEAEPVAFVMADDLKDSSIISTPAYRDLGEAMERTVGDMVALYTAPPAPANAEPVAWLWSHRKHPSEVTLVRPEDDERAESAHWSGWSCQALYAVPPATTPMKDNQIRELVNELRDVAVEYHGTQQLRERIARTIRAAMLQGAKPVTTKDDGGRYEQDDSPECGWVVTHSGKDYFYREQKDAVMHMNSAVESGRSVSLRSLIPEPVSEPYKLNDPVIPESSTCKYCGGTGYFRWQQSENMCPCPCVGCDMLSAPQQEVKSGD